MSVNSFGHILRVSTWGESHGPAIGCVVDGCPPGIAIEESELQHWLDRRRPGQSKYTTQRREPDQVRILSGVFQDEDTDGQRTTGTPISLMIENVDQRSKDYSDIKNKFRPGHADFTYHRKYGFRDYRGGGRSSARETAMRVAAGGIARKIVPNMFVKAALVQMGPHKINRSNWNWDEVDSNPFFCPDKDSVQKWAGIPRRNPQVRVFNRGGHRGCRGRNTSGSGSTGLCQAGPGYRFRDDEHQCRQGRGDRRRIPRRRTQRRRKCR